MPLEHEIARLNVLLECFSDCAAATDVAGLLHRVNIRLCWVIDFDRCVLAVAKTDTHDYWQARRQGAVEKLEAELPRIERAVFQRVMDGGSLVFDAKDPHHLGIPLVSGDHVIGALYICNAHAAYERPDLLLAHHVGAYLGTLVERIQLERVTRRMNQRKDELLALLGHELRNPLAPIVTAVHLLKLREPGEPSRELAVIERQAQHMVRLIDDLLDIARLIRGNITLSKTAVEFAAVVARAIDMSSPLINQHQHFLRVDVPSHGLIVEVDEARLAQVFANLLNNAARYTDPGGHLAVVAYREGAHAVVEVSDDGIGIASDVFTEIFEAFQQHSPRSSRHGGLGLGLSVAKQITELHGGSIEVKSDGSNRGSNFIVRIRCLPAEATLVPPAPASAVIAVEQPERILLVDDNGDALDLLAMSLKNAGHSVAVARDGPEALSIIGQFRPSVAVLDLGLPVMDGCELATRIRGELRDAAPYLVALTGYAQERDRERTRAAGFAAHLVKPVDTEELLRIITAARDLGSQPVLVGSPDSAGLVDIPATRAGGVSN